MNIKTGPQKETTMENEAPTDYSVYDVARAFGIIKAAMIADSPEQPGSYAHSWHRNIAMACYDAMHEHLAEHVGPEMRKGIANDAASRFMKICFDVETQGE